MTLSNEELFNFVEKYVDINKDSNVLKNDCDIIEFLLDNCEITIPDQNRYFVSVNCEGITKHATQLRLKKYACLLEENGLSAGAAALAYTGEYDFGHTTAEWESVIKLGVFGLRNRIVEYLHIHRSNEKMTCFYNELIRVYDAALRFIKRASVIASSYGKTEMANGLLNLSENSPANLFEALQTSIIYYTLQHIFDGTNLRTLGRLDKLFYPYYIKESKDKAIQLIFDYVKEIDQLKAPSNIPFAIGGTDADANSLINELSYVFLDIYGKAQTTNTKMHILCSEDTPEDIIEEAFQCIREGNNSIVFMSDKKVIESLEKIGAEHIDAVNYHVVGCYECGSEGELTCSCNARVNIPKAVELALNGGKDMLTDKLIGLENNGIFNSYDDLWSEFERQLIYLCNCAMKATDLYEVHYRQIHSSPILSGTYTSALENAGDLYCDYAAKYNNSSVNAIGIGTAVDSLAAIRKAVFEDRVLTLHEFTEILKSNWEGKETLRLMIKNKFPKFGQGDKKTDTIAKKIVDKLSDAIIGKPNSKGGKYRLGLFSIDWRWEFGKKTAASADGRLSGETLSQNTSATFGADKAGATAHLISATMIDTSKTPNGAIVDIDLHSSAVRGQNGIKMLVATLKTYFELGGFAVHYNVLDTEILKDAKLNPEKYPTLQVRLCGWNVLFSSLCEKEKDEFISRSIR